MILQKKNSSQQTSDNIKMKNSSKFREIKRKSEKLRHYQFIRGLDEDFLLFLG
jgi:hypothetical protein